MRCYRIQCFRNVNNVCAREDGGRNCNVREDTDTSCLLDEFKEVDYEFYRVIEAYCPECYHKIKYVLKDDEQPEGLDICCPGCEYQYILKKDGAA